MYQLLACTCRNGRCLSGYGLMAYDMKCVTFGGYNLRYSLGLLIDLYQKKFDGHKATCSVATAIDKFCFGHVIKTVKT